MAVGGETVAAGVVLVGGRSSRMGTPKAALEWHGTTLLRRTVGVLSRVVAGPLLVVRAPGQQLPEVPPWVRIVEDPQEGLGPLQGIAAALAALAAPDEPAEARWTGRPRTARIEVGRTGRVEAAFVSSTDLPFLHPAFVRRVCAALTGDVDVVLPVACGHPQPLAAGYRVSLASLVAELVAAGELRPTALFRHPRCRTLRLDRTALLADPGLAAVDPALDSLINVNSPEDYHRARCRPAAEITVQRHGLPAARGHRGPCPVRAATLADAAAAVGLTLDRHLVVTLNGEQIDRHDVPLVSGDTVTFHSVETPFPRSGCRLQ